MPFRNHPLTNAEGDVLSVELVEPVEVLEAIQVTDSAMAAVVAFTSTEDIMLEVWGTVDMVISFAATPLAVMSGLNLYRLKANEPRLVYPLGTNISAICDTNETGVLYVNILRRWNATKKDYQADAE